MGKGVPNERQTKMMSKVSVLFAAASSSQFPPQVSISVFFRDMNIPRS